MRVDFAVLIIAAAIFVADARAAGRTLTGCKKQDCEGYKKKNGCFAAEWRKEECECGCTDHGWGASTHDCGDWSCKEYEAECKKVYMDFKDCACICHGSVQTPLVYSEPWYPGQGGAGGHGGGGGGRGGRGGGFGGGRGGDGGGAGQPGQPGRPG